MKALAAFGSASENSLHALLVGIISTTSPIASGGHPTHPLFTFSHDIANCFWWPSNAFIIHFLVQRPQLTYLSVPTLQHIYLKMNRLFATSLLVVLLSILLATPALAMGPDPSRKLKVGCALD